ERAEQQRPVPGGEQRRLGRREPRQIGVAHRRTPRPRDYDGGGVRPQGSDLARPEARLAPSPTRDYFEAPARCCSAAFTPPGRCGTPAMDSPISTPASV